MIRMQIQLTSEQIKALRSLSERRQVSISELVRQGADMLIAASPEISKEERRRRALAAAGTFRSAETQVNVAEDHDRYLMDSFDE